MATTFCVSGAVLMKAGTGVSSDISDPQSPATPYGNAANYIVDDWINDAETIICALARYNFIDDYATINDDTKLILRDLASSMAALNVILYDMSGYMNLRESENKINVLRDGINRNLSILRDKKVQDFINGA